MEQERWGDPGADSQFLSPGFLAAQPPYILNARGGDNRYRNDERQGGCFSRDMPTLKLNDTRLMTTQVQGSQIDEFLTIQVRRKNQSPACLVFHSQHLPLSGEI